MCGLVVFFYTRTFTLYSLIRSDFVTDLTKFLERKEKEQQCLLMDSWSALGIFLLGAGAGAGLTAAHYAAQIRLLRQLLQLRVSQNLQTEQQPTVKADEKRKSA